MKQTYKLTLTEERFCFKTGKRIRLDYINLNNSTKKHKKYIYKKCNYCSYFACS